MTERQQYKGLPVFSPREMAERLLTSQTNTEHDCQVDKQQGQYRVWCPRCGQVGVPQENEIDALGIADWHAETGGFERQGKETR